MPALSPSTSVVRFSKPVTATARRTSISVLRFTALAGFTALPGDAWWEQSRVVPAFQRGAEWLRAHLPASVAQEVNFVPVLRLDLSSPAPPPAQQEPDGG